jgi:hypothetical protein
LFLLSCARRYLGDVYSHTKPYPWVCGSAFPELKGGISYQAFVFLGAATERTAAPAAAAAAADTCGGNCPNGCSSCPCGADVVPVDASHWCNLGDRNLLVCMHIASRHHSSSSSSSSSSAAAVASGASSGWNDDSCYCMINALRLFYLEAVTRFVIIHHFVPLLLLVIVIIITTTTTTSTTIITIINSVLYALRCKVYPPSSISPCSPLPPSHANAAAATEKADGFCPFHSPQTCVNLYNFHNCLPPP